MRTTANQDNPHVTRNAAVISYAVIGVALNTATPLKTLAASASPVLLPNLVVRVLTFPGPSKRVAMVQASSICPLTVRDNSPEPPPQRFSQFDRHGRGRSAVAGLSRALGVRPTADGGKVVWAVLNAARPTP